MKEIFFYRIIVLVIFILFTNQALAAEWVLYEKSATGDEYYDKNSIKKINHRIINVWTKVIYNDAGKYKKYSVLKEMNKAPVNPYLLSHELVLFEVDCFNKKIKITSERICDKRGGVIASKPHSNDKWIDIVPNTKFEKIKNKVCDPGSNFKIKKK